LQNVILGVYFYPKTTPMKQLFIYTVIAALFLSTPSEGQQVLKGRLNGNKSVHTEKQKQTARQIYKRQLNCPGEEVPTPKTCNTATVTPKNCGKGTQYCDDPECILKIVYCHEICLQEFEILTRDDNGVQIKSRPFKRKKLEKVISSEKCDYNSMRCYIYENGKHTYYRIGKSPDTEPQGDKYETYYSIALLRGILDGGDVKSVRLYRGVSFDQGGAKIYLLPFEVTYRNGGGVKYFDVSDTQP
jgi:hypothetical protein